MSIVQFYDLKTLCLNAGFKQRGNSYFRVHGDGVLQVVKLKKERHFDDRILYIGLFSMYSELEPQLFTSRGCRTDYSIKNFVEQNCYPITPICFPTETQQLRMFAQEGISLLDQIDDQSKLIGAISTLDPRWIDALRIAPYLHCGQRGKAIRIMKAIKDRNSSSYAPGLGFVTAEDFLSRSKEQRERDAILNERMRLVFQGTQEEIADYLNRNYEQNLRYAGFCLS